MQRWVEMCTLLEVFIATVSHDAEILTEDDSQLGYDIVEAIPIIR
jgi:hypothetical protein